MTEKKRSPAFWVGCGCLGCLGLLLAALAVVSLLGFSAARSIGSGFGDPETRQRRVEKLLGTDTPEGYYPLGGIGVPFFIDAAMLVDRPQPEGEPDLEAGDSLFVFFQASRWLSNTFVEDKDVLSVSEVDIDEKELLGEGEIQLAHYRFDYRATRGELRVENEPFDGIMSLMEIECFAGTDRFRFALWMTPPPDSAVTQEGETPAPPDYSGTPADEATLAAFMQHFDPCR